MRSNAKTGIGIALIGVSALVHSLTHATGPSDQELVNALAGGNVTRVEQLLTEAYDINAVAAAGATALMIAYQSGHVDVVDVLLDNGGWMHRWFRPKLELNKSTIEGATALAIAYNAGEWEIVDRLIDAEAEQGDVAIYVAVMHNDRAAVEELISQGLDVNREVLGSSALVEAVKWGRAEIVRLLLDSGVDVNQGYYGGGELVRIISTAKVLAQGKLTLLEEAQTRPEALHGLSPQLLKAFKTGGGIDEMHEIVRLLEEAELP